MENAQNTQATKHRRVRIAGSLPPLRATFRPDLVPPWEEMVGEYEEIVKGLSGNVDLFLIETMSCKNETFGVLTALQNVEGSKGKGKEIWLSFSPRFKKETGKIHLIDGESLEDVLEEIISKNLPFPSAILFNCTPFLEIHRCLPELKRLSSKFNCKIGAYPNDYDGSDMEEMDRIFKSRKIGDSFKKAQDFNKHVFSNICKAWVDEYSLDLIGGCCGTGPDHIKELAKKIRTPLSKL